MDASVGKTEFVDTNTSPTATANWYYWIIPIGAAGNGLTSEMLAVKILPA